MEKIRLMFIILILIAGFSQASASGYREQLLISGYSEKEINDILTGKRKRTVIDFHRKMQMTGYAPEGYSAPVHENKNRAGKRKRQSTTAFAAPKTMKNYNHIIHQACRKYNISKHLVYAVIKVESDFNPNAISKKGAIGLMGLMPKTAEELGCKNPYNPWENIFCGVKYFRKLYDMFGKSHAFVLAAYNAGPTKVKSYKGIPPYPETRNYIKKVNKYMKLFNLYL